VDRHSVEPEPLIFLTEEVARLRRRRLTNELAAQRLANSSFTVLSAALFQMSKGSQAE
jgi:hypothetical protein